jgi:hypothetical protein
VRAAYTTACIVGGVVAGFIIGWRTISHKSGVSLQTGYSRAFLGALIGLSIGVVVAIVGSRGLRSR